MKPAYRILITACVIALSMWWGYHVGRGSPSRTQDVRDWAGVAYDIGYTDGEAHVSKDVRTDNRKFVVDSVVMAHNGAWH